MVESINIDRIQTSKHFDFKKNYTKKLTTMKMKHNYSPFSMNTNECKYFTSVEFSKSFNSRNISLSMFCIDCHSLEAHWDSIQELLFNMSSNGITLDLISLTDVFKIQDILQYNINGYHSLLINTKLDTDNCCGGIGLCINETFIYFKQ